MVRHIVLAGLLSIASTTTLFTQVPAGNPVCGFTSSRAESQRALEARLDSALKPGNLREWLKRMTARPHHLGSPYGREVADFLARQFREWGYETQIAEYQVLMPTPTVRTLELIAPQRYTAKLAEPAIDGDSTSGLSAEQLPVYNAYSIDGDVTGELVYVNYGVPDDYAELARHGIDVKGRIVLARYGGSWRGIKPKVAAEHGAVGCIIYSDPREDGYFQGDPYPAGGWRPDQGAQRGSVADMPLYPGDPLTPGAGATKDAKRPPFKEAATLTKIPVLPISWADALPLLKALSGPMAPAAWRGALPLPYRLGPGPARAHLKLQFDWKLVPAYDVIAFMRGSELPDQWIIRGNHHDAWVNGATDPSSGMAALMEEARAIAELARSGWKPRRTIVFAAWDGEEPGLLGSTEWVEANQVKLLQSGAVYVNSDSNARGLFSAGGSPALEQMVNEAAREVMDPRKQISVAERALASIILSGTPEDRALARERRLFELDALGSGSDYTPFLQHLGISSLNIGFGGEGSYGQYHSIYDSFDHYVRFMDPDFSYGIALVKVAGRIVLRLSDADVLPFEFTPFARAVSRYASEVEKLTETMRAEAAERNRRLDEKVYEAAAHPDETWVAPPRLDPVPYLNFAPLKNAAVRVDAASRAFDGALETALRSSDFTAEARAAVDRAILASERSLTRPEGLPDRAWFRHQVYAPGFYTGYGVKTLPAVRESIEQRRWKQAEEHIAAVAATLDSFAQALDRAAALLPH